MCGILGIWSRNKDLNEIDSQIKRMSSLLTHRGPDNKGFWSEDECSLFLSHQRLSIIDLSIDGNQPMKSNSGRYVISFNGEIYNHKDLKIELEKNNDFIKWRSKSDTEVLLELIDRYGIKKALNKCIGMFAFAIWDRKERNLILARDRMGEKPLYYGFSGSGNNKTFLFSSELSALKSWKYFDNNINLNALSELFQFQVIFAPNSIYKGIYQLLPGHLITINNIQNNQLDNIECWWNPITKLNESLNNPINDEFLAENILEGILKDSLIKQSIADVPLGTFLSGGIDSSLITALLQSENNNKIKTFTIGFEDVNFDEAHYAKEIANHLKTDHEEFYFTENDAQKLIPRLSDLYSEPFADSSQLPTHLVSKIARDNGLKVALTGDGGDELFGGYTRYIIGEQFWPILNYIPFPLRREIGFIGKKLNLKSNQLFYDFFKLPNFGVKINKLFERLTYVKNNSDFYISLLAQWKDPSIIFNENYKNHNFDALPASLQYKLPEEVFNNLSQMMMIYDSLNYLPNDILTKVDRASMSVGLETRAPFLDHRIFEFSWRLNKNLKIKKNNFKYISKYLLRRILYKYVPKEMIERPKCGFGVPMDKWLRGPLKEWTKDMLSEKSIKKSGYINSEFVNRLYQDHLEERADNSSKLWPIIVWQSWLENNY